MNAPYNPAALTNAVSFDGATYSSERDGARMVGQLEAVFLLMMDGAWRSPAEIAARTGYASDASITARLRDLKKVKFGFWAVDKRHEGSGLWRYRVRRQRGTKTSRPVRAA